MSSLSRLFPILTHANAANAITATNALLGVLGIGFAARGSPALSLLCGALAMPCDVLDGVVARKTGTTSAFGAQLDSLADAVSFALLPASVAMAFRAPWYTLGAALLFAMAGLLRLARFGVVGLSDTNGKPAFEGVPTLFAASVLQVVAAIAGWLPEPSRAPLFTAFYLFFAPAMVSSLPFPKRGLHTRAMWILVPLSLAVTWIRLR